MWINSWIRRTILLFGCILLHIICITIYVQAELVDPRSLRISEDIGGLRGCKSFVPNQWGHFNQIQLLLRMNWIISEGM
jgi:hypothetical protein